jgi:hypothetical protein
MAGAVRVWCTAAQISFLAQISCNLEYLAKKSEDYFEPTRAVMLALSSIRRMY